MAETALLEALNVADVLLPYIEDSDRALHFQLNGLNISVSGDGIIRLSSSEIERDSPKGAHADEESKGDLLGEGTGGAGAVPLTWLTFRLRVMMRSFIGDILALSGLD